MIYEDADRYTARVSGEATLRRRVTAALAQAGVKVIEPEDIRPDSTYDLEVVACNRRRDWPSAVLRRRAIGYQHPIVIVGHDLPCDVCDLGLDWGADAWIPQPMIEVQLSRIARPLLRRASGDHQGRLPPSLVLDTQTHEVRLNGIHAKLRPSDFRLFAHLVNHRGAWQSETEILRRVFAIEQRSDSPLVRVHIRALRIALKTEAHCIQNQRGFGYRYVHPKSAEA